MEQNVIENQINEQDKSSNDFDFDEDLNIHHKVPLIFENKDWDDLTDIIRQMDVGSMDQEEYEMARRNKQILLSIRQKLKRNNLILRASYKGGDFQIFKEKDFQRKASNYMKQMGIYSLIEKLPRYNGEKTTQKYLINIVNQVEITLYDLFRSKNLTKFQYNSMYMNRSQIKLSYLYFIPENDKQLQQQQQDEVSLRPILVCNNGPTMLISDVLSELLWSIFDRVTQCQKFSQTVDVVQALELYAERQLLHPTTLFVTFSMDDICTVLPHKETIEALEHFLNTYALSDEEFQRQGMSINTILTLVRLVLENQYFVYNNALYQQMAGGASGLPLTMPLAYIYLCYWKPTLINTLIKNTHEIFGRYLNEAFFTWNASENDLHTLFDMTSNKHHHPTICIQTSIGSKVHFIDTYLSHRNGVLHTKVYHYPNKNENLFFDIPYVPICFDPKLIRKELIHATRCCLNLNDFNNELNHMKLLYIFHGYPMTFIKPYIQQFFKDFGVTSSVNLNIINSDDYKQLRLRVIKYQQRKNGLKKQEKLEGKNTIIFHCSVDLHASKVAIIKQAFENVFQEYSQDESDENKIKYKLVPHQLTCLSSNDYLINKRPPLRLLTLSKCDVDDDDDSYDSD